MKKYDIVLIGAGSVGLPLSYFLASKGKKVAVIEKNASAGQGENKAAIGGIRATHSDPAKITICKLSIDIVKNIEKEHHLKTEWLSGGYLFPVYEEEREIAFKKLLKVQKKFGLNIDWIDSEEIERLVPGINTKNLRGGTYSPEDGSASPMLVAGAFYKLALEAGVDFYFNETVESIDHDKKNIKSIKTDKEIYEADLFVNCAGGYAKEIGEMAGLDLPVKPDSHEAAITEPVKRFFTPMIVDVRPTDTSDNYYFYQNSDGQVVFCITPNPKYYGKDKDNTSMFLPQVTKRMLNIYPKLKNIRIRRSWRGVYPMTPDGFPIVGYTDNFCNLLLAVGMCGQGFMLGPGLGKILSEIIVDKTDDYNFILEQLSLYRNYSGNEMLK